MEWWGVEGSHSVIMLSIARSLPVWEVKTTTSQVSDSVERDTYCLLKRLILQGSKVKLSHFNYIDQSDHCWNSVEKYHVNHNWCFKMLQIMLRYTVMNVLHTTKKKHVFKISTRN